MKKIIIVIAFFFAIMQGNAQQEYDTIIYYSPELLGCEMSFDTTLIIWGTSDFTGLYSQKVHTCYVATFDSLGNPIPPFVPWGPLLSYNDYKPEGFAQPYHLDSNVIVCGIAARVHGVQPYYEPYGTYRFRLMDENYNELTSEAITSADTIMYNPRFWQTPMKQYYFKDTVRIRDFYLTADMCTDRPLYGTPFMFNHTRSIFDTTPCLDTILGCQSTHSPLLKKNGQWVRFADDTIYEMFQKTFIEFLPILLVPREDSLSLLKEINIDNTCNIYPNPAKDKLYIVSKIKINDIEIYDLRGIKLKTIPINSYEKNIDISEFSIGNYIVKINTIKGTSMKKLLKE
jgi:hypothetical protein